MEKTDFSENNSSNRKEEKGDEEIQEVVQSLPKENRHGTPLLQYQGIWYPSFLVKPIVSFQRNFQAHDTDLILASCPKSGTTWTKALMFMIMNRSHYDTLKESPLLSANPHELVPCFEFDVYMESQCPNLEDCPRPRIFATHVSYASLPSSITDSKCRIVYVYRDPSDQLISFWQFLFKLPRSSAEPVTLDEYFEMFCGGVHAFGPVWDHVLGYWKACLERPDKVLFLKYEDMREDIISHMKRLAEFMGFPFSEEEEKRGVVHEISRLCSFETLKDLEANKKGERPSGTPNSAYFRKGKVGDWGNYLTPSMVERMEKFIEEKYAGFGLTFNMSCPVQKDP